jgi:hypothetical protein
VRFLVKPVKGEKGGRKQGKGHIEKIKKKRERTEKVKRRRNERRRDVNKE